MYRLFTTLLAMCIGFPGYATTVLILLTKDAVYIGADGMSVQIRPNGKRHHTNICKVRNVGNCYFTSAGIATIQQLNFDVFASARRACKQPGTLADKAAFFQKQIYPLLTNVFAQKSRVPIIEQQNIAVVFAGIELGGPTIIVTNFWQDKNGVIQQRRGALRGRDTSLEPILLTLGIVEAIEKSKITRAPRFSIGYEFIEMERLLQLQIEKDQKQPFDDQLVGPPIVLLEVSKERTRWIRSGACREFEPRV